MERRRSIANGKPLELLAGSNLLYLLEQHAGVRAKIEVPDTWKDPFRMSRIRVTFCTKCELFGRLRHRRRRAFQL